MYTDYTYFTDTFTEFCPETTSLQYKDRELFLNMLVQGHGNQRNLFLRKDPLILGGNQSGGMNTPTKAGSHLKMSTNTIHQFPINFLSYPIKVARCS